MLAKAEPCAHPLRVPIPQFNEHGLLPEGVHDCTMAELAARVGNFQSSDRRPQLFARLERFVAELRRGGFARELVVDGSFVTAKPAPNDIDLILVMPADWDLAADLTPDHYNLISKKRVRNRFGFDMLLVCEQSADYQRGVNFFQSLRDRSHLRKGLLRLRL